MRFFNALGPGCWTYRDLRVGDRVFHARVGLRPESFREVRLALRMPASEWPDVFADVAVMEEAVLEMDATRYGNLR